MSGGPLVLCLAVPNDQVGTAQDPGPDLGYSDCQLPGLLEIHSPAAARGPKCSNLLTTLQSFAFLYKKSIEINFP